MFGVTQEALEHAVGECVDLRVLANLVCFECRTELLYGRLSFETGFDFFDEVLDASLLLELGRYLGPLVLLGAVRGVGFRSAILTRFP